MGVYLRDNMGCMTGFGYVILDTNLPTFVTIQACTCIILKIQSAESCKFSAQICWQFQDSVPEYWNLHGARSNSQDSVPESWDCLNPDWGSTRACYPRDRIATSWNRYSNWLPVGGLYMVYLRSLNQRFSVAKRSFSGQVLCLRRTRPFWWSPLRACYAASSPSQFLVSS